ncbi:hypothetical protein ACQEVF_57840 [Nonomuraea polychroma]|uniref:hypothetical protein n=1 Tax=Nonomuraea polychroma TaxID=46176 RepID=UPI003D9188FC
MNVPKDDRTGRRRLGPGRRWRARLGVVTSIAILLSGLLTPSAAHAGDWVPCPASITEWRRLGGSLGVTRWEGYRFTLFSATPQFLVSDGRQLDNNTDQPVEYTISSSVSSTFTVSVTVGVTANVGSFLTTNVSRNIVMQRQTSLGVTLSTTVPPRTRLIAEYGVEGYNVSYGVEAWRTTFVGDNPPPPDSGWSCEEWGYYPQNTVAPTHLETWRLRTA